MSIFEERRHGHALGCRRSDKRLFFVAGKSLLDLLNLKAEGLDRFVGSEHHLGLAVFVVVVRDSFLVLGVFPREEKEAICSEVALSVLLVVEVKHLHVANQTHSFFVGLLDLVADHPAEGLRNDSDEQVQHDDEVGDRGKGEENPAEVIEVVNVEFSQRKQVRILNHLPTALDKRRFGLLCKSEARAQLAEGVSEADDSDQNDDHKLFHVRKHVGDHADQIGGLHEGTKEVHEFEPLRNRCDSLAPVEQLVDSAELDAVHIDKNEDQRQRLNVVPGIHEVANKPLGNQLVEFEQSEPEVRQKQHFSHPQL